MAKRRDRGRSASWRCGAAAVLLLLASCAGAPAPSPSGDSAQAANELPPLPPRERPKPAKPGEPLRIPTLNLVFVPALPLTLSTDHPIGLISHAYGIFIAVTRTTQSIDAEALDAFEERMAGGGVETERIDAQGPAVFVRGSQERHGETFHSFLLLTGDAGNRVFLSSSAPLETPELVLGQIEQTMRSVRWTEPIDHFELLDFELTPTERFSVVAPLGTGVVLSSPQDAAFLLALQIEGLPPATSREQAQMVAREASRGRIHLEQIDTDTLELDGLSGYMNRYDGADLRDESGVRGRVAVVNGPSADRIYVLFGILPENSDPALNDHVSRIIQSFSLKR